MKKGMLVGALGLIVLGVVAGYFCVVMGMIPANADAKPGKLETWIARKSLRATLKREVVSVADPLPATDENLIAGIKLYADNCLVCHGAADGKPSKIARGLYLRSPQFALDGVEDDPEGRTYWLIEHGVRLTGMPSYGATLSKDEIWKICLFLKHMDGLPQKAMKAWESLSDSEYHKRDHLN